MFVDASVVVAILAKESGWEELLKRIADVDGQLYISALVRLEATLALGRVNAGAKKPTPEMLSAARDLVDAFIVEIDARNVAINEDIGGRAIDASIRYGKAVGHPADLNFGDCFSYACAKALDVPLLFKGNDFLKTDLA
ncbi:MULTISPECIES: type II toxin-antitoxin system VapC family toxin [unclassified Mesorhizobium]|uniref:type II toxin-antitoxin system VapC family toxin n=1 Tax=unclassified Mesorhizobium TaxID=325217 RepID=UPI001126EFA9|nr:MULTISPECIES: type II toxin-antitoxin system VapC family toxin [unclassified Mesorhizobium]MBZ9898225.1 type II toxin-antitoxin system VapC family toxin [Mesorhizobium sp. BR1-1-6]MBZ9921754.1 type II toxin-antitoxin system VapC family toxin [Mesorhizobium sp. BR1-1-7]MBZ9951205.1 type II toxin-antitoxin system VapC family toxin [Mesorhizobium sp. BR1-1-15]MBZ9969046.1 type II toxin-antitoxin system VapC family toxin [Mesorhizobium sp. BR1-1-12]MBZ9982641.1 type II toxin-antitoxin system Va